MIVDWWRPPVWRSTCAWIGGFGGVYVEPIVYDYGTTVVYRNQSVYIDDDPVATVDDFYLSALDLANRGATERLKAEGVALDDAWLPFGTFAILEDADDPDANKAPLLQLAVNKQGFVRGNLYSAVDDTVAAIEGAIDTETQRVAFRVVGEDESIVAECGLWNLTEDTLSAQVHFPDDNPVVLTLVRLSPSEDGADGK